ncbi:hypothetical protein PSQ90_07760 [Devosia rhodophyticola]|uniref:DUF2190 family protein n=1 Tax=Devosia rhodophyticola TaxID=3026423 RepID=A0ABY7Z143_9HYPH|nr:hypothetical protein [Devosia rhodophyticola]WDR07304.1 hypothetical protein PSQ90_07760 [Devosia rhodophyticola]
MRDLANNIAVVQMVAAAVISETNTSAAIDLLGFESAALVVNTGAIAGSGDYTAKLQHSDTTTGGDFVDVPAASLVGTLPASLTENGTFKQGYIGTKRYLRSIITKNSGTSIAAGTVLIKGNPQKAPA